jgi:hypothetical protein
MILRVDEVRGHEVVVEGTLKGRSGEPRLIATNVYFLT